MSDADIRTRLSAAGYDPDTVQHVLHAGGYFIAHTEDAARVGRTVWDHYWPYPDLKLCTPHCPMCGTPGVGLIAPSIYPMLWCENEECEAMSWDPSKPARELIENAAPARWVAVDEKGTDDEG